MEVIKCQHDWKEDKNKLVCSKCSKYELLLKETDKEGLKTGTKDDGTKYSVRDNRSRYFFPDEWKEFISKVPERNKIIFETLIMTGARIQEAMMIKKGHIKFDKKYLILYTTKIKARKRERKPVSRNVSLSKSYLRKIKSFTNAIKDNDYIFLNNDKCKDLATKEVKENFAYKKSLNVYQLFKRILKKTNIEDTYNFSLQNIRKTHGMWLKCLNIKLEEICLRLGHDPNTYLKHYGSADIFDQYDKPKMINILGDIYNLK